MLPILHALGTYPLAAGLAAQAIVLFCSLKSGDKKSVAQSALLMAALTAITVSIALRPPSPPNLMPDLIAVAGAALLLTPAVQALGKMRRKEATG